MTQYKLYFVIEGKPFNMPEWTIKKHEILLNSMLPLEEQLKLKLIKQSDYDKKFRVEMILSSLREIDPKVTENDLSLLHPDDFVDLWVAVYNSGKKGVTVNEQDFQKGEKSSPK